MIQVLRLESAKAGFSCPVAVACDCIGVFLCLVLLCTDLICIAIVDRGFIRYIFILMENKRGRPPKKPSERRTLGMHIPMTDDEREQIKAAAESDDAKPVTWARETLLRAAKRRNSK